jgi:hypothetical protein
LHGVSKVEEDLETANQNILAFHRILPLWLCVHFSLLIAVDNSLLFVEVYLTKEYMSNFHARWNFVYILLSIRLNFAILSLHVLQNLGILLVAFN